MTKRESPAAEPMLADSGRATPWREARGRLEKPEMYRTYWLATVRPDGAPHVMPVLGLWLDDAFYFITGASTRKGRNLAENPRCVLALGSTTLPSLDLVLEGNARKVTGKTELRRVAGAYKDVMQWPLKVGDGEVSGQNAPTAGPPPYAVFELKPTTAFGLPGVTGMAGKKKAKRAFNPTRWRFEREAS